MKNLKSYVEGMSCGSCSASLQNALEKMDGVESAGVNLATKTMSVTYDEKKLKISDFNKTVTSLGFKMTEAISEENEEAKRKNMILALIFGGIEFVFAMAVMNIEGISHVLSGVIQLILTSVVIWAGRGFFTSGAKKLVKKAPNMDTLVALGTGSAYIYSVFMMFSSSGEHYFFESAAVVIALISLGKYLEEKSKKKSLGAISGLLSLVPEQCNVEGKGVINTSELKPGDIIVLKAGEKVPCDCVIVKGKSDINDGHITGESMPREVCEGEKILGGTLVLDGALWCRAEQVGGETLLSKIIEIVEQAQSQKAPIAKIADRVALYFVPAILLIAFASAAVWLILGKELFFALRVFVSVLVIACPCALGLATPLAIITATGRGAKDGIIFKSGEALETASKAKHIVFDKTGTLTRGQVSISDIFCYDMDREKVIKIGASLEKGLSHPLARAVSALGEAAYEVEDFKAVSGFGVIGKIDGRDAAIGNKSLMEDIDISVSALDEAALQKQGRTLLYVAYDGRLVGLLGAFDTLRETSAEAIEAIKKMGITPHMLTGDNEKSARAIADSLGIESIFAGVTPEKKSEVITQLKTRGVTIMVGDGINDAPALSEADVGISMGQGTDVAEKSSQVVLMKSDPMDVLKVLKLSRKTLLNIKQNLFWAFLYNCLGVPFAAGVFYTVTGWLLSPMIAGGAMALSSICVVLNALRLRNKVM